MIPFDVLSGPAAVLARAHIDTDQILPARFLRKPRGDGYHRYLFHDMRAADPDFPLAPSGNPAILIAGDNFGCGSSREGAVYALADAGLRCVIAPGFGDIFAANASKNGMPAIVLAEEYCAALRSLAQAGEDIAVDLSNQQVRAAHTVFGFEIDPFRKHCLLKGLDDIGLTLTYESAIESFERRAAKSLPWTLLD